MRVNQHVELQGLTEMMGSTHKAGSRLEQDRLALAGAEALNRALQQTPDFRAEEVDRAGRLVGQTDYPTPLVTDQIASLLAQYMAGRSG